MPLLLAGCQYLNENVKTCCSFSGMLVPFVLLRGLHSLNLSWLTASFPKIAVKDAASGRVQLLEGLRVANILAEVAGNVLNNIACGNRRHDPSRISV